MSKAGWDYYFELVQTLERDKVESVLKYMRATERYLQSVTKQVLSSNENWINNAARDDRKNLNRCSGGGKKMEALANWYDKEPKLVAAEMRRIWAPYNGPPEGLTPRDEVFKRIRKFSSQLPRDDDNLRGPGGRMGLIATLLMRISAEHYPPFGVEMFKKAYKITGHPQPPTKADEASLYKHALEFLDKFVEEARARILDWPRNLLEAQSVVYMLRKNDPKNLRSVRIVPAVDETDPDFDPLPKVGLQGLADELLIERAFLGRIEKLLADKRQVVFQGPPGTGKTYVARKLAECLAGSAQRVRLVQFHPSYAYEDFVQGFRPVLRDGQPGFELTGGPLLAAAEQARAEPDKRHFLVIDEINRGDLSKVFGELYFLLEYRNEEMILQYSAKPFSLPDNLYFIGTMNTADRSIALVDLALRRRFHFVEFHPDKPPVAGLLARWLAKHAAEWSWLAAAVDRANEKLSDRQAAIGPSYFMKRNLDDEMVRLIWEHNVLPYVEEHLYGEHERLREFDLDALRKELGTGANQDGGAPPADDGPSDETD